jgi:cupin 2 domain-containing protein
MTRVVRGRLLPPAEAPSVGEKYEEIARMSGAVVQQILSGALPSPLDYDQDHDEWVVVLNGGAVLEVGDERLDLVAGDWVLLRAHMTHRLVDTQPETCWLAVHSFGEDQPQGQA